MAIHFRVSVPNLLVLRLEFTDIAGNNNSHTLQFFVQPFYIQGFTVQIGPNRIAASYTTYNKIYVQFTGFNIYRFRIKTTFDGTNTNINGSNIQFIANQWSDWMPFKSPDEFWGSGSNDGFDLNYSINDFGYKNVTVEVTNGFDDKPITVSINYVQTTAAPIDWVPILEILGFIGIGVVAIVVVRGMIKSREWTRFMDTSTDSDK
jgi:hypothetical protein